MDQPSDAGLDFASRTELVEIYMGGQIFFRRDRGRGTRADGAGGVGAFATVLEPFRLWRHEFLGMLGRATSEDSATTVLGEGIPQVLAGFQLRSTMVGPPIIQGSQGDDGVTAGSGTIPRTARRYEQLLQARGPVRVGSQEFLFDGLGLRVYDRTSAGIYESGSVGHTWATGLLPSGRGFSVLVRRHQPDGRVGFCFGHYFDGHRYHEAEVLQFPDFTGVSNCESDELVLRVDDATIRIQSNSIGPLLRPFGFRSQSELAPHAMLVSQGPAQFVLDGEVGGGVLERSLQAGLMHNL